MNQISSMSELGLPNNYENIIFAQVYGFVEHLSHNLG